MSVASLSPPASGRSADTEPDLPALGAALWRRKWRIIVPTILATLLALAAVQVVTPRYLSEARVIVEARDNIYLRPDLDKDVGDRTVDEQAVISQAQLILSRDLAREVIDKLKLGTLPEFDPTLSNIPFYKRVLGALGLIKNPLSMTPQERVLESYYDRLTVTPVEKSRVITIDFLSSDPELAARVANAIADAYLVRQRETKQQEAQTAAQWLAGQIEQMRKKVAEADNKVAAFRAKSNLLIVGTNNNTTTLSAQQLGDFNTQLTAARAQQADAEAKAKMIRDMLRSGAPIESSDILNSELIRRLSEQRVTLRAQLAEQSSTLLGNHPRIKELKAQIADLEGQMRAEAETIARAFDNDAKLAGARVASLTDALEQFKSQAATSDEQDVQLRALQMDAKSERDLLESYLAKYREATSRDTINSTPADARVFSRATVSNVPAYPKKLPTVLIVAVTSFILSAGFALTKELLAAPSAYAQLLRRQAIERDADGLGPRAAAVVAGDREGVAPTDAASVETGGGPVGAIEDIGELADRLRQAGPAANRIAVLGVGSGSTSQTAIRLARALAEESRTVLVGLCCGDLALKRISNEPGAAGLSELAEGSAGFGDVITKDRLSPLHLISAGQALLDRDMLLAASGMTTNFEALSRSYDHVVIDAGAVEGRGLEAIAAIAPQAILVADAASDAAAAHDALVAAGFTAVTTLVGARGTGATTAAAA